MSPINWLEGPLRHTTKMSKLELDCNWYEVGQYVYSLQMSALRVKLQSHLENSNKSRSDVEWVG